MRQAAALTAELAAQSEKKTAVVCDQPPGLDELAGHIEAPNMVAGGSHPQATMMPDPWATHKCPSGSDSQAETSASSETSRIPADKGVLAQTRVFRGARLRSTTRAPSTRSRGPNLTKEESRQRNRTEQEQRLCRKKEEAWELYQRQSALTRKTRENFETKFREKVLGGIYWNSKDEQERDLQLSMSELEKVAQEEERRLEAFEKKRMDREDGQSRSRQAWDRIFQSVRHRSRWRKSQAKPTRIVRMTRERKSKGLGRTKTTLRPHVGRNRKDLLLEETQRRPVKEVYTSFDMYVHSSGSFASIYSHTGV